MARYSLAACLLAICPALIAAEHGFGGTWILNTESSQVHGLPEAPDPRIRIAEQGATLHWFAGEAATESSSYGTDGHVTRWRNGATAFSSQSKWEGTTLLINTIVTPPGEGYTVMDHWRLSRDGNRLSITRQISRRSGETEANLIYQREGTSAPPVTLSKSDPPPALRIPPGRPQPTDYVIPAGSKFPLRLVNSVSTKHSSPGDRVYLETVFPILTQGRIVVPAGSYVIGSVTEVKRAGRVKGKSEMFVRFDSLTLPNGVTRDFRSRMASGDGGADNSFDRSEGKIKGEGGAAQDARTIGTATAAGTGVGAIAGSAAGHLGMGAGIGAAAGALGGLAGVLATRGPDAVLEKGSTIEMVLDRQISFTAEELNQPR